MRKKKYRTVTRTGQKAIGVWNFVTFQNQWKKTITPWRLGSRWRRRVSGRSWKAWSSKSFRQHLPDLIIPATIKSTPCQMSIYSFLLLKVQAKKNVFPERTYFFPGLTKSSIVLWRSHGFKKLDINQEPKPGLRSYKAFLTAQAQTGMETALYGQLWLTIKILVSAQLPEWNRAGSLLRPNRVWLRVLEALIE